MRGGKRGPAAGGQGEAGELGEQLESQRRAASAEVDERALDSCAEVKLSGSPSAQATIATPLAIGSAGVGLGARSGDRIRDAGPREQIAQRGEHVAVAGGVGADGALVVGEDRAQRVGEHRGQLVAARPASRRPPPAGRGRAALAANPRRRRAGRDVVGDVADRVAGHVGERLQVGEVEDAVFVVGDLHVVRG